MKHLQFAALIAMTILLSSYLIGDRGEGREESKTEMRFVQVNIFPTQAGIYIYEGGELIEKTDLNIKNRAAAENGEKVSSIFSDLSDEGWELHQTNGGDNVQNYVWIRNKN